LLRLFYHITRDGQGNIAAIAFYKNGFGEGSGTTLAIVFSGDNG
jgi:hypothetical protein